MRCMWRGGKCRQLYLNNNFFFFKEKYEMQRLSLTWWLGRCVDGGGGL